MPGEVVKFYCACGQKVGVPRDKVGSIGHCPRCNSPLEVPEEGCEAGGDKVFAAVKLEKAAEAEGPEEPALHQTRMGSQCRSCGKTIGLLALQCKHCGADTVDRPAAPRGRTSRRSGRGARAVTGSVSRLDDGGGLPLWFWLSFCLDAALLVAFWQVFQMPWYYGLLLGEIAGWTLRVVGFKLNL